MEPIHVDPSAGSAPTNKERRADSRKRRELVVPSAFIGFLLILVVVMAVIFMVVAQTVHTL